MIYIKKEDINDYMKNCKSVSFYSVLKALNIYDSLLLCNNITKVDEYLFDNIISGSIDDDCEIYQFFLFDCSDYDLDRIKNDTDLLVFYSEKLELYVLGVTHFGTSWDYVGCDCNYEIID